MTTIEAPLLVHFAVLAGKKRDAELMPPPPPMPPKRHKLSSPTSPTSSDVEKPSSPTYGSPTRVVAAPAPEAANDGMAAMFELATAAGALTNPFTVDGMRALLLMLPPTADKKHLKAQSDPTRACIAVPGYSGSEQGLRDLFAADPVGARRMRKWLQIFHTSSLKFEPLMEQRFLTLCGRLIEQMKLKAAKMSESQ